MSILLTRAFTNHAIRQLPPRAVAVNCERMMAMLVGNPEGGEWIVQDNATYAHLRVWPVNESDADADDPLAAREWYVAWTDGPRAPGSGRAMAETICGEPGGGVLTPLGE